MERRCPQQGNAWAEADRLMLFGEEIMARVVVAEAARLLGPLRPCPFQKICSVSGPGGGEQPHLPVAGWQQVLGQGREGGVRVSCPHNTLDPTLVGRGTVPLGVWLGLAEFGGVLKELPLQAREGLPLPLVHFLPATQSLTSF